MRITLRAQIEELKYELNKRDEVYPRLVRRGTMTSGDAQLHMERMEAVLRTLQWLDELLDEVGRKRLPDMVRQVCSGNGGGDAA